MRMEFSFHPVGDEWPFRCEVPSMPDGDLPAIYLLPPHKPLDMITASDPVFVPLEPRRFFRKTFVWCRPASFDGVQLTRAYYAATEIRFFEGRDSMHADDRAQEYIRGRMEGTLWPRI